MSLICSQLDTGGPLPGAAWPVRSVGQYYNGARDGAIETPRRGQLDALHEVRTGYSCHTTGRPATFRHYRRADDRVPVYARQLPAQLRPPDRPGIRRDLRALIRRRRVRFCARDCQGVDGLPYCVDVGGHRVRAFTPRAAWCVPLRRYPPTLASRPISARSSRCGPFNQPTKW